MEINPAFNSRTTTARRWQGTSPTQSTRGDEWDLLDHADGGSLARYAKPIPAGYDVPSILPNLGKSRCICADAQCPGRRLEDPRPVGFVGVFHRRHVRAGQKGGERIGKTKRGKGSKIMVIADRHGLPVSVYVSSASPHESQLVEPTLAACFVADEPRCLIGDKAYDSDRLDALLASRGIEMIAPHRINRRKPSTQDGRPLRRYRRRWKIERLHAWLQNQRRIVVRYERKVDNYIGFVHLACLRILLLNYF